MKPGDKQDKDTVNNILDGLEESENHKGDGDDASSTEEGQGELFPPDVHSKF
ncbi:hypothetical protein LBR04_23370 [Levilactobacillus brevis]|nr:hypothetical protein LBR04_23370 [Levilactobacillus brevis]